MTIPVLGTAIVNGPHWLQRLINSVDYPVDNFVIFNNNGRGEIDKEIDAMIQHPHPFIKNIKVCHLPQNIGVSGAWNMVVKCYMNAPFWLITNHDVAFTPGLLEELYTLAMDKETKLVFGHHGNFNQGSWDMFILKESLVQSHGLFDENFYPAYNEDADYIMRLLRNPVKTTFASLPYFHGESTTKSEEDYIKNGQQTKKGDAELHRKLEEVNLINFEYMFKKWGDHWRMSSPHSRPFDDSNNEIGRTTYDLEYVRRKHLGF